MQKVLVIMGQTATGKSALAVQIARKIGGEVISADSRQVYRGLDIGSGKFTQKEMRSVPHHLLNVANPKRRFTVAQYKKLAENKIKEIIARSKMPIICGGTGFYIDAVTRGVVLPEVPPNNSLRKKLEKKSYKELFQILKKLDPGRAKNVDKNNRPRLIRAIEIAQVLGKVPIVELSAPKYKFIKIGLYLPPDKLREKIEIRMRKMFRAGLLQEINKLKKMGISEKRLKEFGFEYYNPTLESVITANMQYARRQMTWFKRDKEIKWFDASDKQLVEKVRNIFS